MRSDMCETDHLDIKKMEFGIASILRREHLGALGRRFKKMRVCT